MQAAIVRDGRVLWRGRTGRVDAARGRAVGAGTRFIAASSAKSVTAAMILRLVDTGRLRLEDRLAMTHPELPGAGRITVRMLLEHSSGYGEYPDSFFDRVDREPYRRWTRAEVLRLVRLGATPGTRVTYSNLGYVVAGGVIERVTGKPLESAFQELVAGPVGLRASTWRWQALRPPALARSYDEEDGAFVDAWPERGLLGTDAWGEVWTDGGLATTATDLARFANALYAGSLLTTVTRDQVRRVRGERGLGTFATRSAGRRWLGHDGDYGGYTAEHWTDVGRGITIAVMANAAPGDETASFTDTAWRRLARAYPQP